ncbi:MAG: hypothetical protein HY934_09905 [Candidatus Firestonebacteria bacterium]|nr:hypothetical protein [Candidatus Firestonebacteria bacterium]
MDLPPTPLNTLNKAYLIAKEKLQYIYVGNIHNNNYSNTYCPKCKNLLIKREGYNIEILGVKDSKCSSCGRKTDIIGI